MKILAKRVLARLAWTLMKLHGLEVNEIEKGVTCQNWLIWLYIKSDRGLRIL